MDPGLPQTGARFNDGSVHRTDRAAEDDIAGTPPLTGPSGPVGASMEAEPLLLHEAQRLLAGLAEGGSLLTPKGLPPAQIGAPERHERPERPGSAQAVPTGLPIAQITTPERPQGSAVERPQHGTAEPAEVTTAESSGRRDRSGVDTSGTATSAGPALPGSPVGSAAEPATPGKAAPTGRAVPVTGESSPNGRVTAPPAATGPDDGTPEVPAEPPRSAAATLEAPPRRRGSAPAVPAVRRPARAGTGSQVGAPTSEPPGDGAVPAGTAPPGRSAPTGRAAAPEQVAPPAPTDDPAAAPPPEPAEAREPGRDRVRRRVQEDRPDQHEDRPDQAGEREPVRGTRRRRTSPARGTDTSAEVPAAEAAAAQPTAAEPTATEPAADEVPAAEPTATEPAATEPAADEVPAAEPTAAEPTAAERPADDPTAEPPAAEPPASDPSVEPSVDPSVDPAAEPPTAAEPPADEAAKSGAIWQGRPAAVQPDEPKAEPKLPERTNPARTRPVNRGPDRIARGHVDQAGKPPPNEKLDKLDDRYVAPRDAFTAPPTSDSPAVPPPPSYSALVGGAVPGDPTSTYSAMFTQRLRAFLPWPTAEDPLSQIIRVHKQIHPHGDASLLKRAYGMAEQMHRGQMRKSGEPFITHPLAVTEILADLGMDTTTLVAALLHDTVEDTSYTLGALERDFGGEVALLVDGVTKFDKVFYGADAEAETIRKMIVSAGRDVRVLVIKLADRLHNMRTLDARSRSSQVRIATATREVLIPLCERLGVQALKRELEDWVLRAVSPSGYALIADYVQHRSGWDGYLERVTDAVHSELSRFKIDATVTPRPRHLYSIWKDTVEGNYAEPHDLPRVVIIIDGPETDCYAALGAVHGKWRPVPGRFKDFIATPKNNLYRSLHTTVLGPEGHSLEVLIRTEAMHHTAEYGIVANFRYPQNAARFGPATKAEQLDWLRRLLDWEAAASDPAQFIASLRCDLAEAQILVFTSTGRPVLLPAEATAVDLAYILGADIGNRCIGARLNGRLISVSSPLADGDTVEIITRAGQRDEFDFDEDAPARGPSPEWLEFVKTPHARLHISRWFEDHGAPAITVANKVRLGRLAIGLALRQRGRGLASDLPLVRLAPRLGFPDLETLLVAVADHSRTADEVVNELIALVDHSPR